MLLPSDALEKKLWDEFREDIDDPSLQRGYLDSLIGEGTTWKLDRVLGALGSARQSKALNTASAIMVVNPDNPNVIYSAVSKGAEVIDNEFRSGFHRYASDHLDNALSPEIKVGVDFIRLFCIHAIDKSRPRFGVPTLLVDFDNEPTRSSVVQERVTAAVHAASLHTPDAQWIYHRPQDNLSVTVVRAGDKDLINTGLASV